MLQKEGTMTAPKLLAAVQQGATRFRLRGEPGTWEINSPINRQRRCWTVRVHRIRSHVYAYMGSLNAALWEAVS